MYIGEPGQRNFRRQRCNDGLKPQIGLGGPVLVSVAVINGTVLASTSPGILMPRRELRHLLPGGHEENACALQSRQGFRFQLQAPLRQLRLSRSDSAITQHDWKNDLCTNSTHNNEISTGHVCTQRATRHMQKQQKTVFVTCRLGQQTKKNSINQNDQVLANHANMPKP